MPHDRYSDLDDSLLAGEIREGSGDAFEELYNRYHRRLYFFAQKYVKDRELAEDAVQDVFVRLWQKRSGLNPSRSIRSYLFTMIRNRVLNMLRDRKKKILSVHDLHGDAQPAENRTEEELTYREYKRLVEDGLDQLTDRKREIFELKVAGLTNAQIAEKLRISINTVKSQYYHGTRFMRGYLKEHADIASVLFLFLFV